jgi:Metallo-beta-lactamase superfamily
MSPTAHPQPSCQRVSDGAGTYSTEIVFTGVDADTLRAAGIGDKVTTPYHGVLVTSNGRRMLVEAGLGEGAAVTGGTGGRLVGELRAMGVEPADIDEVIISHAHADHIGGVITDGEPTFARASPSPARGARLLARTRSHSMTRDSSISASRARKWQAASGCSMPLDTLRATSPWRSKPVMTGSCTWGTRSSTSCSSTIRTGPGARHRRRRHRGHASAPAGSRSGEWGARGRVACRPRGSRRARGERHSFEPAS